MKHYKLRRQFLKNLMVASGAGLLPAAPTPLFAQSTYNGKFVIALQLDGGVDVTSFSDPKVNVSGEAEINHWANGADPLQSGNLVYAPFADNAAFFEKYYQDTLVINGVDAQTNSHSVGVVNNWSGRNSEGFPTITSLFAATMAPELPLSYLNFGGFGATEGVIRSTRVSDPNQLRTLISPNKVIGNSDASHLLEDDWSRIQALHASQMESRVEESDAVLGNYKNREAFLEAISRTEDISRLEDFIPEENEIQQEQDLGERNSNLNQQIQIALLSFKAGVSVSADIVEGGFDSHDDNDARQEVLLTSVVGSIDYLWTTAEELGIADRLLLVIGSDFGRTPRYNANDGKDHWPIGSTLIMERNATYTNRMLGETDEGHNAYAINPDNLQRDDTSGVIIKPAHVHKALRQYLELNDSPVSQPFAFNTTADFSFFN
ncbi:MAG: DUF1501 domain-containing protein [Gammaproteobacteria bacterium]|nr:DUF1501 domain-containing protein [Gammaproteobacteria bacterium]